MFSNILPLDCNDGREEERPRPRQAGHHQQTQAIVTGPVEHGTGRGCAQQGGHGEGEEAESEPVGGVRRDCSQYQHRRAGVGTFGITLLSYFIFVFLIPKVSPKVAASAAWPPKVVTHSPNK